MPPSKFHSPKKALTNIVSVRLTDEEIEIVNRLVDNDPYERTASQLIREAIRLYASRIERARDPFST